MINQLVMVYLWLNELSQSLSCPVWASIIALLLISCRVGTDHSATHTHTHQTLRVLGNLPAIPDSYPNMHAVSAGNS